MRLKYSNTLKSHLLNPFLISRTLLSLGIYKSTSCHKQIETFIGIYGYISTREHILFFVFWYWLPEICFYILLPMTNRTKDSSEIMITQKKKYFSYILCFRKIIAISVSHLIIYSSEKLWLIIKRNQNPSEHSSSAKNMKKATYWACW